MRGKEREGEGEWGRNRNIRNVDKSEWLKNSKNRIEH